ncbi:MAG: hypothetical protein WCG25_09515 [bacterium]
MISMLLYVLENLFFKFCKNVILDCVSGNLLEFLERYHERYFSIGDVGLHSHLK